MMMCLSLPPNASRKPEKSGIDGKAFEAPHPACRPPSPEGEAEDLIDGESSAVENFQ